MEGTLKSLNGLLCKCHAKVLLGNFESEEAMQVDTNNEANKREVRFESLYDILFNAEGGRKG